MIEVSKVRSLAYTWADKWFKSVDREVFADIFEHLSNIPRCSHFIDEHNSSYRSALVIFTPGKSRAHTRFCADDEVVMDALTFRIHADVLVERADGGLSLFRFQVSQKRATSMTGRWLSRRIDRLKRINKEEIPGSYNHSIGLFSHSIRTASSGFAGRLLSLTELLSKSSDCINRGGSDIALAAVKKRFELSLYNAGAHKLVSSLNPDIVKILRSTAYVEAYFYNWLWCCGDLKASDRRMSVIREYPLLACYFATLCNSNDNALFFSEDDEKEHSPSIRDQLEALIDSEKNLRNGLCRIISVDGRTIDNLKGLTWQRVGRNSVRDGYSLGRFINIVSKIPSSHLPFKRSDWMALNVIFPGMESVAVAIGLSVTDFLHFADDGWSCLYQKLKKDNRDWDIFNSLNRMLFFSASLAVIPVVAKTKEMKLISNSLVGLKRRKSVTIYSFHSHGENKNCAETIALMNLLYRNIGFIDMFDMAQEWDFLISSVTKGDLACITKAIDAGSSVDNLDQNGRSLLMLACQRSHPYAGDLLIGKGADIHCILSCGHTILTYAVSVKNIDFIEMLFRNGADASLLDGNGKSALDIARLSRNEEIISLLESWVLTQSLVVDPGDYKEVALGL